jgi:phosphoenolpyruvate carboxylase
MSLIQIRLLKHRRAGADDVHLMNAVRRSINRIAAGLRVAG